MASKKITLQFISRENELLRVTTFGAQSLAESTIKTYEEIKINWDYLRQKTAELLGLLRRAAAILGGDERILEQMQELGNDLYRDLIPPSLRGKLDQAAGGDMLLSIDGNLVGLPWELLHDGVGFLSRRYNMGRIISIPPSSRRGDRKRPRVPVKLLSVANPTGDLPGAFREGVRIRDRILDFEDAAEPVLLANRVHVAALLDGMKRCDILHFAGHVETDDLGAHLRLFDGECSAAEIRDSAGRYPFPCLVFMNACRSSQGDSDSFSLHQGHDRAFDLASSFLLSGARIFLGTLWDIPDAVAGKAGVSFFTALLSGSSVGEALSQTREKLINDYGEASMTWAGYLLYGDPGFRIEGTKRLFERFSLEMDQVEKQRETYLEALKSEEPQDRFFAACALYQMGDRRGETMIRQEIQVLLDLLKSESLRRRRQGETVLNALVGPDHSFVATNDRASREQGIERFLSLWKFQGET